MFIGDQVKSLMDKVKSKNRELRKTKHAIV